MIRASSLWYAFAFLALSSLANAQPDPVKKVGSKREVAHDPLGAAIKELLLSRKHLEESVRTVGLDVHKSNAMKAVDEAIRNIKLAQEAARAPKGAGKPIGPP